MYITPCKDTQFSLYRAIILGFDGGYRLFLPELLQHLPTAVFWQCRYMQLVIMQKVREETITLVTAEAEVVHIGQRHPHEVGDVLCLLQGYDLAVSWP